jgi:hypothetical protein
MERLNALKLIKCTFFLLFFSFKSWSQVNITGKVTDASSGKPVAYASIGIIGTPYGTVCDEDGKFELPVKNFKENDSLKIAAIGYLPRAIAMSVAGKFKEENIQLKPTTFQLAEVTIKPEKTVRKVLGNKRYNKNVYCSFTGSEGNYKGCEAAIRADNKKNRLVWLEDFNFYILKNLSPDSISFRLNFYSVSEDGLPGVNILRTPVVFKTKIKEGIVNLDLRSYNISTRGDFFISLECLEDKMSGDMLSYSGSISGPAYFKPATFAPWVKSPFMGLDFNVTVSYIK